MSDELIKKATESTRKKSIPDFTVGDTVGVAVRIVEGDKERQQVFTGTVIGRKGGGASETFTVRRIVNNEGVERVFPVHSPRIADIQVVRSAKTRRAKLYYLRDRVGKATRLKQAATKAPRAKQAPQVEPEAPQVEGNQGQAEAAEQE